MSLKNLLCLFLPLCCLSGCIQWSTIEWQFKLEESIDSNSLIQEYTDLKAQLNDVALSPDGKKLALAREDGVIQLWDMENKKQGMRQFKISTNEVKKVAFSPNGKHLAISGQNGLTHIWHTHLLKEIKALKTDNKGLQEDITSITYSFSGHYLASGGQSGKVTIWDIINDKPLKQFERHRAGITALAFSNDDKWLASASWDSNVYLWDWQYDVVKMFSHQDSLFTLAFEPSNSQLISGGDDRIIHRWDIVSESKELIGNRRSGWISSVATSPNGKFLALSTGDNTLELWDIEKNMLVNKNSLRDGVLFKVIFDQNGKHLLVSSTQGVIRFYTVPSLTLLNFLVINREVGDWFSCSIKLQECRISYSVEFWFQIAILIVTFSFLGIIFFYLRFYHHPLLRDLSADPEKLFDLPIFQLNAVNHLLKLTYRLNTLLVTCQIASITFQEALTFTNKKPNEQVAILAKRLGSSYKQEENKLFVIYFSEYFPLNLQECLLYFPDKEETPSMIVNALDWEKGLRFQKIIILSLDPIQQQILRPYGEDIGTLWIVPNAKELTRWLLSPTPSFEFAKTVSTQLKVIQISPYQTQGGINKNILFFGRIHILSHILHREMQNYIVVGGRQIGKSSLLKYLERHYQNHPTIVCHYLSLGEEPFLEKMATVLKMPIQSSLEQILNHLSNSNQPHLFLLDETDKFIEHEIQENYRILSCFRNLAEERHCYFILAGFWNLYQTTVLNYHSPLRNFGEMVMLAELEKEACHDLIVKPLESLNIRIVSNVLVEKIINLTGQRANLITIICNEMLKNLDTNTRSFSETDVTHALNSTEVYNALLGWENLTANELNNHIDRLIIYATLKEGTFTFSWLLTYLETVGNYSPEQIKSSLNRLTLSFIIRLKNNQYTYCVPLFRCQFLQRENIVNLLNWESQMLLNYKTD